MKFDELNATIPYVIGGKEKVLTMRPYPSIQLAMPGRHAKDTMPKGGDFVVRITDKASGWTNHEFTHTDIFVGVDLWKRADSDDIMPAYLDVINGKEPRVFDEFTQGTVFLRAMQCLAVAEHRRYAVHEAKWGGRFLPFRFAAGIAEGLWTVVDSTALQRRGRPGVEMLESKHGIPKLTRELMSK